jgi:hypothetical protein
VTPPKPAAPKPAPAKAAPAPVAKAAPAPVAKAAPTPVARTTQVPRRVVQPAPAVKAKPAPQATQTATRPQATRPTIARSSTATAPSLAPEVVEPAARVEAPAAPAPSRAPDAPLVIIRKSAAQAPAQAPTTEGKSNGNGHAKVAAPPVAPPPQRQAPKAQPQQIEAKPVKVKEPRKERKEKQKNAKKRERKHHRHSKRVNRRAASLDLKDGERVSLSIEGWSRLRRATLVVTNYRVALITQLPPLVKWIPLEEVSTISHRWHGAHSIVVGAPTEVLTLQKAKRQMLASFEQLLESEVAEARRGGYQRHHADITQEWCDRATQVWDSRFHRFRLWIRRHPTVTVVTGLILVAAAYVLSTSLTSLFSPTR